MVSGDEVVATTEGKEKGIGLGGLERCAVRLLYLIRRVTSDGDVGNVNPLPPTTYLDPMPLSLF